MPSDEFLEDQTQHLWSLLDHSGQENYSLEHFFSLDSTRHPENLQCSYTQDYSTVHGNMIEPIDFEELGFQQIMQFSNLADPGTIFPIWDVSDAIITSGSSNTAQALVQPNQALLPAQSRSLFVNDAAHLPVGTGTLGSHISNESSSAASLDDIPDGTIGSSLPTSSRRIQGTKRNRNERSPLPGQMCFRITPGSPGPTIQQRASNSESARKKRHTVRKLGACLRCKWMKRTCSGDNPCKPCEELCMRNFQSKNLAWVSCIRLKFSDLCIFTLKRAVPGEFYDIVLKFAIQREQELVGRGRFFHTAKGSKSAGQPTPSIPVHETWTRIESLLHESLLTSKRINLLRATVIPTYFLVATKSLRYVDWINSLSTTAIGLMDKIGDPKVINHLQLDEHVSLCLLLIRLYSVVYRFKLWYLDKQGELASVIELDLPKLEALLEITLHFSVLLQNHNKELSAWYGTVASPGDLAKRRKTIEAASVINTDEHLNDARNYLKHLSGTILDKEVHSKDDLADVDPRAKAVV